MYAQLIKEEILKRGITRLCHFTKTVKLLHILSSEEGILSTQSLDITQSDVLTRNDECRFDGHTEYISCSVQYPNTWYLSKIRNNDSLFKEWVVILIDPSIMCNQQTKFCHRNAAACNGAFIKSGIEGFKGMFANSVQGKSTISRSSLMLPNCPTDGQAEVLIYNNIPRSKILGVAVPSIERAKVTNMMVDHIQEAPSVNWVIAPDLFNNNWNSLVKQGKTPDEVAFRAGGD